MVKKQLLRIMLVFLFLVGSFFAPMKGNILAFGNKHVLVYETSETLIETFKRSGFNVLEVYDTYFLAEVTEDQVMVLEKKGITYVEVKDILDIHYANYLFHPDAGKNLVYPEEVSRRLSSLADDQKSYFLLQFIGPVKSEWISAVEELQVEFYYPLPYSAFLVRTTPLMAKQVQNIRYVRAIGQVPPILKANPDLLSQTLPDLISVSINTIPDINLEKLFELVQFYPTHYNFTKTDKLGFLTINDFPSMLIRPVYNSIDVISISRNMKIVPFNAEAAQIVQIRDAYDSTYPTLNEGDHQIIAVADTGLSTGDLLTLHPAFQGKIHAHYGYRSTPYETADWSDFSDGTFPHGTHVSGTVLGNGADTTNNRYKGMAPKAWLVIQSFRNNSGGLLSVPVTQLLNDAYDADARIMNNSWGYNNPTGTLNVYDETSVAIDTFMWDHKDFTAVWAAGNNGHALATMEPHGNSKNVVAAGASLNNNNGGNPANMAIFSQGGWAHDGRIKPDVVAPGMRVLSTVTNYNAGSPVHTYTYAQGTSMAAPVVTGSLGVIREYFTHGDGAGKIFNQTPSSALLKASLINGAFNEKIYDETGITQLFSPSRISGWGRVDVRNSIVPEGKNIQFYDMQGINSLTTGQISTPRYFYVSPASPLKVTLVWTDYPGSPGTAKALVNNLDLKVTNDVGQSFFGNAIDPTTGFSVVNPETSSIDTLNNVEVINIKVPEEGIYTFSVYGTNIPSGPQPYALIITGSLGDPALPPPVLDPRIRLSVTPAVREIFKGTETTYNARVTSYDGASGGINYSVQTLYNSLPVSPLDYGISYSINPLSPSLSSGGQAESVITVNTTNNTPLGLYQFRVTASTDTLVSNTVIVDLNVIMEPYFDFDFTPSSIYIQQEKSGSVNIDISTFFGFSEDVQFEVDPIGLPNGFTFEFKPNPTSALMKYQTKLTIGVALEVPVGKYQVIIIGKNITTDRDLSVMHILTVHVQKRVSIYDTQVCMQSSPETVEEEGLVKYRIQIKNTGNEPLTNNTLIFELDPNLEFVFSDPAGSYANGELYVGIRDLSVGECYPASNCEAIKFPCISDIDGHYVIITARVKPFRIKPDNGTMLVSKLTFFSNPFYTETFSVQTSLKTKQAAEYPLYFRVYFENLDDEGAIASGKEVKVRFKIEGGTGNYTYNWDWNDGQKILDKEAISEEYSLTHTYNKAGVYRIKIEARDAKGRYKKGEVILRVK